MQIMTPDGVVERKPQVKKFGNFVNIIVRWKNRKYFVGDGGEYLRGMPEEMFELKPTKALTAEYKCGDETFMAKNKIDALNMYLIANNHVKPWEGRSIDYFPNTKEEEERVDEILKNFNLDIEVEEL